MTTGRRARGIRRAAHATVSFTTRACRQSAAAIILVLPFAVILSVLLRYFLNHPMPLVFELSEFAMLFATFLAAPFVAQRDEHVRVEIIGEQAGSRLHRATSIFAGALGLMLCLGLGTASLYFTVLAYESGVTMNTQYRPPRWLISAVIPLGFYLVAYWQAEYLLRHLRPLPAADAGGSDAARAPQLAVPQGY